MFIVLEGLDGAGKSTQIALLKEYLLSRGRECRFMHFPRYDQPVFGELIGRFLRGEFGAVDKVDPYLVALLYAGDRADAASVIRGWLDEGLTVVVDRYVCSNIGYQCAKIADSELRAKLKRWIIETEYGHFNLPRADVQLFLDVPFEFTARNLAANRSGDDRDYLHGACDIHEQSLDLQQRVRRVYLDCALSDPTLRVIDCTNGSGAMAEATVIFGRMIEQLEEFIK